jgi:AraC-like DNA-binding protein
VVRPHVRAKNPVNEKQAEIDQTARFVLFGPAAGETRYFTGFAPPEAHRDRAVLKAQEWVHMRDGRGVSLAAMATVAGVERRTLLRRFASATGMRPDGVLSSGAHCASGLPAYTTIARVQPPARPSKCRLNCRVILGCPAF